RVRQAAAARAANRLARCGDAGVSARPVPADAPCAQGSLCARLRAWDQPKVSRGLTITVAGRALPVKLSRAVAPHYGRQENCPRQVLSNARKPAGGTQA